MKFENNEINKYVVGYGVTIGRNWAPLNLVVLYEQTQRMLIHWQWSRRQSWAHIIILLKGIVTALIILLNGLWQMSRLWCLLLALLDDLRSILSAKLIKYHVSRTLLQPLTGVCDVDRGQYAPRSSAVWSLKSGSEPCSGSSDPRAPPPAACRLLTPMAEPNDELWRFGSEASDATTGSCWALHQRDSIWRFDR